MPPQQQEIELGYTIVGPAGEVRQGQQIVTLYPGDPPVTISLGADETIQGFTVTKNPGQTYIITATPRGPMGVTPPALPGQPVIPPIQPGLPPQTGAQPTPPFAPGQPNFPVFPGLPTPPPPPAQPGQSGQTPPPLNGVPPTGNIFPYALWALGITNPSVARLTPEQLLARYGYAQIPPGRDAAGVGNPVTAGANGFRPPGASPAVFSGRFYPSFFPPGASNGNGAAAGQRLPEYTGTNGGKSLTFLRCQARP